MVFDWNVARPTARLLHDGATLLDETLRDGLQNASALDPSLDEKIALVHRMDALRIHAVNLGLPASSDRNRLHVLALAREIASERLRILPCAAGRTLAADLAPIAEVSQKAGIAIEAYAFIGSSAIRALAESWDLASVIKRSADAIAFAVKEGLRVCYVTEDTTRTHPDSLRALFENAIDHGAKGICLADTVGHATPDGVRSLVAFARSVVASTGARDVRLDWHGHNDRGLALQNALWALEAGVDRVHGTALGIGERVGNVPIELVMMNLARRDEMRVDFASLARYCDQAARALGWTVPPNHPLRFGDSIATIGG